MSQEKSYVRTDESGVLRVGASRVMDRLVEGFLALVTGPNNAWFRMVVGYWDMAASLVQFKAIDQEMFNATAGEMLVVYAKLEPFLNEFRSHRGEPHFLKRLETQVQTMPNIRERLPRIRRRFRKAAEARAKAAAATSERKGEHRGLNR